MATKLVKLLPRTLFGAISFFGITGLAAVMAVIAGAWSGLGSPWNYTLAYGIAAVLIALALAFVRRYKGGLPPPWGDRYAPAV